MKATLLIIGILLSAVAIAGQTDSLSQKHQLSISMTNGMSYVFFKGASGLTTTDVASTGRNPFYYYDGTTQYSPDYAFHLRVNISSRLAKFVRLEYGMGYLFQQLISKTSYTNIQDTSTKTGNYTSHSFIGKLSIAVHVKFIKPIGKGAFSCTLGPTLYFDIHGGEKTTHVILNGASQPDRTYHYSGDNGEYIGGFGADLKMGYERKLGKRTSIDVGPIVSFNDLAIFESLLKSSSLTSHYRPFSYYVGLDLAISFGLKK